MGSRFNWDNAPSVPQDGQGVTTHTSRFNWDESKPKSSFEMGQFIKAPNEVKQVVSNGALKNTKDFDINLFNRDGSKRTNEELIAAREKAQNQFNNAYNLQYEADGSIKQKPVDTSAGVGETFLKSAGDAATATLANAGSLVGAITPTRIQKAIADPSTQGFMLRRLGNAADLGIAFATGGIGNAIGKATTGSFTPFSDMAQRNSLDTGQTGETPEQTKARVAQLKDENENSATLLNKAYNSSAKSGLISDSQNLVGSKFDKNSASFNNPKAALAGNLTGGIADMVGQTVLAGPLVEGITPAVSKISAPFATKLAPLADKAPALARVVGGSIKGAAHFPASMAAGRLINAAGSVVGQGQSKIDATKELLHGLKTDAAFGGAGGLISGAGMEATNALAKPFKELTKDGIKTSYRNPTVQKTGSFLSHLAGTVGPMVPDALNMKEYLDSIEKAKAK